MALNPTLPQWLTQTPDPASIIARGSSAGGQAADARLAAERVMVQQNQFAQEIALREAAAQREAQQQAAVQAARQEELEIRRTLAESEIAKEGRMAAVAMMTAQQKARQSAEALALQYDIQKNKMSLATKEQAFKAAESALGRTSKEKTAKETNEARIKAAEIVASKEKPDLELERLRADFAAAQAEYRAVLYSDAEDKVKLTAQKKVEGLGAKMDELEKQRRSRPTKTGSLWDEFLKMKPSNE